uniref:Uncharacterized protein n=1 Tax=Caudovirales sp. ctTVN2 TaxID=2827634 RepID=A0A8S5S8S6_9CAUD|nr:MAG TPA: hypothetical protein [Caudovirales sp. ctTVN2]
MSKVVLVTVSSPRFPFGVDWLSTGCILPPRRPNVNYFFEKFEKMLTSCLRRIIIASEEFRGMQNHDHRTKSENST